ncbi:hypothetical protein ACFYTC_19470 [Actinomadura nitritigenes]
MQGPPEGRAVRIATADEITHAYSGSGTSPCDLITTVQLPPSPAPAP